MNTRCRSGLAWMCSFYQMYSGTAPSSTGLVGSEMSTLYRPRTVETKATSPMNATEIAEGSGRLLRKWRFGEMLPLGAVVLALTLVGKSPAAARCCRRGRMSHAMGLPGMGDALAGATALPSTAVARRTADGGPTTP